MTKDEKLLLWQQRLSEAEKDWNGQIEKIEKREKLYAGRENALEPLVDEDYCLGETQETPHLRNIIAENIEAQVNSTVPQPKVTARRKKDEWKAALIEELIRNELDRLPMERLNDMDERTTLIQGGDLAMVEWNSRERSHTQMGENEVKLIHPIMFRPQPGIYGDVEDMDWYIIAMPTTRRTVKAEFGVDLPEEAEAAPEAKSVEDQESKKDLVTRYMGFEKTESGISRFQWARETVLEDAENYRAPRQKRCGKCHATQPAPGSTIVRAERKESDLLGALAGRGYTGMESIPDFGVAEEEHDHLWQEGDPCPYCGGTEWSEESGEWEELYTPMEVRTEDGTRTIPGAQMALDESGAVVMQPTRIPVFRPNCYPVALRKNVSAFGQLLGSSDADAIADQQNTINRMTVKAIDKLCKAGDIVITPDETDIRVDSKDHRHYYVREPSKMNLFGVKSLSGDITGELTYIQQAYTEAQQRLGITDSFLGRKDTTATSGTAKQFAAQQSAGRLESKRVMKEGFYEKLFRRIFENCLAYAREKRPLIYRNERGEKEYAEFDRYIFLEQDAAGEWYWNTDFLFSCDSSTPLAKNREQLWAETTSFFQAGAFGDPTQIDTLIAFWRKMERLHYPGAADTKAQMEQQKAELEQAALAQQQMQQTQMQGMEQQAMADAADEAARRQAAADAGMTTAEADAIDPGRKEG